MSKAGLVPAERGYARSPRNITDAKALLKNLLRQNIKNEGLWIISAESFHINEMDLEEITELKIFLDSIFDEINIIAYAREPGYTAKSLLSTLAKWGAVAQRKRYSILTLQCSINTAIFKRLSLIGK